MQSHLTILANDAPLALPDDFSIDIDFQNPLFNEVEMSSYPVQIPVTGNRRLLQNIEVPDSDMRVVSLEHTPVKVLADGMPFCSGTMVMSDEEEVVDSVSVSVKQADRTFSDLIGDLTCQDIPVKDRIVIGEKVGNLYVKASVMNYVTVEYSGRKGKTEKTFGSTTSKDLDNTFEPQALGFSYPAKCVLDSSSAKSQKQIAAKGNTIEYRNGKKLVKPLVDTSYINVAAAYGETDEAGRPAYYCNARVCYKHYGLDEDGQTSDKDDTPDESEPENFGKYWVLDADRPQSGICFYVLYFLDCLFDYLGVSFDKSALLAIEDFKHLCFYTTRCSYSVEVLHAKEYYQANDPKVVSGEKSVGDVKHAFWEAETGDNPSESEINHMFDDVNEWLSSRGCGGQLSVPSLENKSVTDLTFRPYKDLGFDRVIYGDPEHITVGIDGVKNITIHNTITKMSMSANVMQMLADSGNFPSESVSDLLSSLESAFGIKFQYDYEQKKVTALLIRDVFRKQHGVRPLLADVYQMNKLSEKITGVRMRYSSESDRKEQQTNVKNGVKDYDTDFDYIQYPDPNKAENGQTSTIYNKTYKDIFTSCSSSDMNVYVDRTTGNAYRIKIDKDYTDARTMKPVLFEVGQWKGVEYGDCSDGNEDFIEDFSIGFTPITYNDVNYVYEVSPKEKTSTATASDYNSTHGTDFTHIETSEYNQDRSPLLVAFMDVDMLHEFVEQRIDNLLSSSTCDILVRSTLHLLESYDTTSTDNGNSPLQEEGYWGMAIALMRGGGTDMTIQEYESNYDGFGNSKYRTLAGKYALCSDTMDAWGQMFDYNGNSPGIGGKNGTWDGTYTKSEATAALDEIFPDSNVNLLDATRFASGYDLDGRTKTLNGETHLYLFTKILADGTTLSDEALGDYFFEIRDQASIAGVSLASVDKQRYGIIIATYTVTANVTNLHDAYTYYRALLEALGNICIHEESGTVSVPVPSTLWIEHGSNPMECFSLKINADKTDLVSWAKERGISLCNSDVMDAHGRIQTKIRSRGLWQTFMIDYGYFLLNRKKFSVRCLMTVAQMLDIPNHWNEWWEINGKRCLINKIETTVSVKDGLGECTLEVYTL